MNKFLVGLVGLLLAGSSLAALGNLRVFETTSQGQLYSPGTAVPGGVMAGDKLYFRRHLNQSGRMLFDEPGTKGMVQSARLGRPGQAWAIIQTHDASPEKYRILKVNVATGEVLGEGLTTDIGIYSGGWTIQDYSAEKDWIKILGDRRVTVAGKGEKLVSEMLWVSLGKGGLKVQKAFPVRPQ